MKFLTIRREEQMPKYGMGTWFLGEKRAAKQQEIEAIRAGIDAGIQLIDTAEMYGDGLTEALIGEAIQGYDREKLFLVSKVYPHNAGKNRMRKSLMDTLDRLQTDYLDLYLIHWRGRIPLKESVECLEELVKEGLIKNWGVSNFDVDDMEELIRVPNGKNCCVNQVLYHLGSRGIEYDLMPWLEKHDIPIMAYCPMAQGGALKSSLLRNSTVIEVARKYKIAPVELLLAFTMQKENVIPIPRSGKKEHVLSNLKASQVILAEEDLKALDRAFPAPNRKVYLDIV